MRKFALQPLLSLPRRIAARRSLSLGPASRVPTNQNDIHEVAYDFNAEANMMINRVKEAVEPLRYLNQGFDIRLKTENNEAELKIVTKQGSYTLTKENSKKILILQSYMSGYQNYYYDADDKTWRSIKDGHDMRGLITRDLLRHCAGCAKFD